MPDGTFLRFIKKEPPRKWKRETRSKQIWKVIGQTLQLSYFKHTSLFFKIQVRLGCINVIMVRSILPWKFPVSRPTCATHSSELYWVQLVHYTVNRIYVVFTRKLVIRCAVMCEYWLTTLTTSTMFISLLLELERCQLKCDVIPCSKFRLMKNEMHRWHGDTWLAATAWLRRP